MTATAKTTVKKTVGHDRLALVATFPSGGVFKFSVTRNGERLAYNGCPNPAGNALRDLTIRGFVALQPGETEGQRLDRIAAFVAEVSSTAELQAAIQNRNLNATAL